MIKMPVADASSRKEKVGAADIVDRHALRPKRLYSDTVVGPAMEIRGAETVTLPPNCFETVALPG